MSMNILYTLTAFWAKCDCICCYIFSISTYFGIVFCVPTSTALGSNFKPINLNLPGL